MRNIMPCDGRVTQDVGDAWRKREDNPFRAPLVILLKGGVGRAGRGTFCPLNVERTEEKKWHNLSPRDVPRDTSPRAGTLASRCN